MGEMSFCFKCKKKQPIKDAKEGTNKIGRKVMTGVCTICGTKTYKILGGK